MKADGSVKKDEDDATHATFTSIEKPTGSLYTKIVARSNTYNNQQQQQSERTEMGKRVLAMNRQEKSNGNTATLS